MYETYFNLKKLPFNLTPNPHFYCSLAGHQEAMNVLEFSIKSGEGFIKIVGEVGSGKTLLCRKILESLEDYYVTAYISNPDLSPIELRKAIARELEMNPDASHDHHELVSDIFRHLIQLRAQGKRALLFIDEAQALSDESLETVRLLTNLETENEKLIQVILFGQPELDIRLKQPHFRQLKQRITFSYRLPLMNRDETDFYLHHRLAVAGCTRADLFTKKARKILFKASGGVPRLVNILSHKAMLVAFGKRDNNVNHKAIRQAISDTESTQDIKHHLALKWILPFSILFCLSLLLMMLMGDISA